MKNGTKLFFVLMVGLVLTGCQTASDRYGSGPVTITPYVQSGLDKYMKSSGPAWFAITTDGTRYSWRYCTAGQGACIPNPGSQVITDCERRHGKPCKIYARGSFVVWDGPTTVGTPSSSQGGQVKVSVKSDDVVCGYSVDYSGDQPKWATLDAHKYYVEEAKRRGFTLEQCDEMN